MEKKTGITMNQWKALMDKAIKSKNQSDIDFYWLVYEEILEKGFYAVPF